MRFCRNVHIAFTPSLKRKEGCRIMYTIWPWCPEEVCLKYQCKKLCLFVLFSFVGSALFIYVFSFANNSVLHIFLSFFGGVGVRSVKKRLEKRKKRNKRYCLRSTSLSNQACQYWQMSSAAFLIEGCATPCVAIALLVIVIQYFTKRNSVKDAFISFNKHVDRTDAN